MGACSAAARTFLCSELTCARCHVIDKSTGRTVLAVWSTETIRERFPCEKIVEPYSPDRIENCAYALAMGDEAFITSTTTKTKVRLEDNGSITIPPGQFALFITAERVTVPATALGLISMKYSFKSRGLINVSGFHVDPGFSSALKFSVYNAGSKDITVSRDEPVFLLWLHDLDRETKDTYRAAGRASRGLSSEDQNKMQGEIASPAELKRRIDHLDHFFANNAWILKIGVGLLLAILIRIVFLPWSLPTSSARELMEAQIEDRVRRDLLGSAPVRIQSAARGPCAEATLQHSSTSSVGRADTGIAPRR